MARKGSKNDRQRVKRNKQVLLSKRERGLKIQLKNRKGGQNMSGDIVSAVKEVLDLQQKYNQGRQEGRYANGEILLYNDAELSEMYNARRSEFEAHRENLLNAIEGQKEAEVDLQKQAIINDSLALEQEYRNFGGKDSDLSQTDTSKSIEELSVMKAEIQRKLDELRRQKTERQTLLDQILSLRKTINDARAKGFRTATLLAEESEINNSDTETLKLHLDNFSRVASSANHFLEGHKAFSPQPKFTLTNSQKRLIAADDGYLWKVLTIPRDRIVKEADWEKLADDCETTFGLLKQSEANLDSELKLLRDRIVQQAVSITERLAKMRKLADEKGVVYEKTPYENMKPWEKYAQAEKIKFELEKLEKEEHKMWPETKELVQKRQEQYRGAQKPFAIIDLSAATDEQAQEWLRNHPELATQKLPTPSFEDQVKKIGESFGASVAESLKGSFDELGTTIENLNKKIDDNTKETLELVKEVKTLRQTSPESTTTERQIASGGVQATTLSPQDFATAFAEKLQRLGIGGTHSPTETDKHGNGNDNTHRRDNAWRIALMFISILGALLLGGIYVWQALDNGRFGAIDRTLDDHAQRINTVEQNVREYDIRVSALEKNDKVQDARLDEHERQIASINTKIAELVSEIERLSKQVELNSNDFVKLNNDLANIRGELREYANKFNLSINYLEDRFGQQIAALDKELRINFKFEVYDFLTFHELAICIFGIGCFGQRSSKPEQPVYSPPAPTPTPERACTSGLIYTNEGTYLVGVTKVWETSDELAVRLGSPSLPSKCFGSVQLIHFDSKDPTKGRIDNQFGQCRIGDENGLFICKKVVIYGYSFLRNIRTTINNIVTWGNVAGGSIP